MIQLLLPITLGILAGTITGLLPGIHINLIAAILLSLPLITLFPPIILIIFVVAMATTHTFLDFIPSIYLGAPDEDTALSTMPGHRFLLKGRGHQAVLLTLVGSAIAIPILILITPIFILAIPKIYPTIQKIMAFLLISISIFLLSKEKQSKFWAFLIFILAGFLGIASLNLNITQPLLTGLFGFSTLIYSISQNHQIPKQKIGKLLLPKKELIKPIIATTLVSPIFSFLPGLGSSQSAIISSEITTLSRKQFLILLGSINTLVMSTSFLTLYIINKSRTGAANFIQQTIQLTPAHLIPIFLTIIISTIICIPLTIKISKIFAKNIHKINYSKISKTILLFLTLIITLSTKFTGLLILISATLLGLLCIYSRIRRGFLMGALLIPTILFYLPF
ncbi:hypothetical protein CMI37_07695 [Candidatus Pacearchaeota archaeon]|nr:hypothetical protein [Candidatus Pacearchaeota archaeon]|tara:strand:- start:4004 stop:5182 length:1179 start_codon:yes stop_codon:yes gene_type:complete